MSAWFRALGLCLLAAGLLALALGCSSEPVDETENESPKELPFGVSVERLGAETDAQPQLADPSLLLHGDGAPVDTAVQAQARHVADAPLVVLAASVPSGERSTPIIRRSRLRRARHSPFPTSTSYGCQTE